LLWHLIHQMLFLWTILHHHRQIHPVDLCYYYCILHRHRNNIQMIL